MLLQTLAILDGFDLRAMNHNSPEYLHTVIEAVKLAFADRDRHYGDRSRSPTTATRTDISFTRPITTPDCE